MMNYLYFQSDPDFLINERQLEQNLTWIYCDYGK